MGMNSGIHDAYCLAEHVVAVWRGADASLLDRYDRRRRTIARDEVQRLSAKITLGIARRARLNVPRSGLSCRRLPQTLSDNEIIFSIHND